ncbi:MAG: hypothetical protein A2600_13330 [Candidatus Lambdaproteobacteria bacterium RIFOXYD1_FULL_56_27]|uniref:Rubrerythrin diiron-binding domain-containing protein n=1 Tax=Candidatus Lambdaproteobacteria bacterium RIFOXYD2_FULL_56_26 TaxID=1817773 RepID=A0A1F6GT18_9PROT|nr:MAG: hypothetical protein A2426_01340 [Candidatus Lambdaproteobacteria bacterium RIFOXYC1_FULL_56_13]OGH01131.1 MAG: hypothetical protein A2557_02760 [Candidatus Lambdaproteobacteria bacterium RIFOXYD2_FULL_56_26]OGH06997.1 MAG: hypothetical protein A2600_13330 [Candidatus Lambdaproteobacteria bacterium RIFOXYD1_FULL_56_27]
MSDFETVLRHAIGLEIEATELYRHLATRADRPEMKKVFEEMAAQEEGHKKRLESALLRQSLPAEKKYFPDEDLHLADYTVPVNPNKAGLTYQEALVLGMKLEKASLELYTVLAQETEDEATKKLFVFLAEEEAKHKYAFESKYDDLL